ncbi:hypothetical protein DE146DRAFT_616334 [Phaeosphaeria sp. MPI-PUGE-AT-0046c]|nr:hypothetical protein DE146DRAFT_616334 [Phaeosphaeria sp. MPI-PUGE-AT-0046c]
MNTACAIHVPYPKLQRIRYEAYILRSGEDWSGITNQKERKRLQNRLNKRLCDDKEHDWLICAAISPFGRNGESFNHVFATVPSSLVPTSLQLATKHHPWLDLFPFPKMRDNMLVALTFLSPAEEQQLFEDIMESDQSKNEWTGLVVWGEPWDPRSWEVTMPFLKRWAWLINGCPEIITSTNHWRQKRGEGTITPPPFVIEET